MEDQTVSTKNIKDSPSNLIYCEKSKIPLPSFALARNMRMPGIERNHTVPKVFFDKGPPKSSHLGIYVPIMPLSRNEHRGPQFSFHNMKDGQCVPASGGQPAFEGCGLNSFLLGFGLKVKGAPFYTAREVSKAIELCRKYHADIGLDFVAAAIDEFRRKFYDPLYEATTPAKG
jgi:hypothetical protein